MISSFYGGSPGGQPLLSCRIWPLMRFFSCKSRVVNLTVCSRWVCSRYHMRLVMITSSVHQRCSAAHVVVGSMHFGPRSSPTCGTFYSDSGQKGKEPAQSETWNKYTGQTAPDSRNDIQEWVYPMTRAQWMMGPGGPDLKGLVICLVFNLTALRVYRDRLNGHGCGNRP